LCALEDSVRGWVEERECEIWRLDQKRLRKNLGESDSGTFGVTGMGEMRRYTETDGLS
jgi:hypothetical protein